jgi:hypothetical protein
MAILNNSNAISAGGYDVNNSVRLRRSATGYLSRTPSTSNRKTWTWSGWVKRGVLSYNYSRFFAASDGSGNNEAVLSFGASDTLSVYSYIGAYQLLLTTTQVFRDPSAWYHIVVALDTTQATSSNRCKVYVNGVQVTAFGTATYPSQNYDGYININQPHALGYDRATGESFDGYMAEVNFIDGSAKTPSDFGETDTTTGVWKPKAYTGTYGTNGFYLKFSDIATTSGSNAGLGKDFSGNSNYWTTNNISVTSGTTYDAMKDSPTNTSATVANYAVWSPLVGSVGVTLSQANLSATFDSASGTRYGTIGTIGVSSGKWYWEYEFSAGGNSALLGITQKPFAVQMGSWPGEQTGDYGYFGSNGNKYTAGSGSAYGATFTTGDVIGVALDLDAGTLTFYKNNTSQGTAFSSITGTFFPAIGKGITATGITSFINFGQRPFAYTPPTGYVALNTYNLPTPTILQGNKYMDATLYTGNGSTQSITNAGAFRPDFVWIKRRDGAGQDHVLQDSNRGFGGTTKLASSSTAAENTTGGATGSEWGSVTAANSNGFSITASTSGDQVNKNTWTYVGWQWQAGQGSTSSNTSGSITSTVSVNTTAGFSIVTFTSDGTTAGGTVGHGLGVAPKMVIYKGRNTVENWYVYHTSVLATQTMALNTTNAAANSLVYNNTAPTSTVIQLRQSTWGAGNLVAYCWAEIAGFSKFGSYTGNGSADGPFVYTGFRPKFVMIKCSSAGSTDWFMLDTSRDTYNVEVNMLFPNLSNAETNVGAILDGLSNGFKLKIAGGAATNTNGSTYIFMAFAENPFKNSLAR